MTQALEVYKCGVCGNIVEVIHPGAGELVCCGQPMQSLVAKSDDQGQEKHLPVVEAASGRVAVAVGSVPHPMTEEHLIEWIELVTADGALRQFIKPGDDPKAEFTTGSPVIKVRAYCNVHGLWSTK